MALKMNAKTVTLCIVILSFATIKVHSKTACNSLTFIPNMRVSGHERMTFNVSDVKQCARKCFCLTGCKSFHFHIDDKTCTLNDADDTTLNATDFLPKPRYLYSPISTWSSTIAGPCFNHTCTASQMCYPVLSTYVCV